MNTIKENRIKQAENQRLSNQMLQTQLFFLNYGRLLKTTINQSEAIVNDAIIAFIQNAKRYLLKMFYPIVTIAIFACMILFTSNTAMANDTTKNQSVDLAQVGEFNPYNRIMGLPPNYTTAIEQLDSCCIKFTFYCYNGWPDLTGDTFKLVVNGGTTTGGNEWTTINANGKDNGISAIICATIPNEEIVVSIYEKIFLGYEYFFDEISIPTSYFAECNHVPTFIPKDCWDKPECVNSDWVNTTITIRLADFPNCPITYKYQARQCGKEHQIKDVVISFFTINCNTLLTYLRGGAEAGPFLPDRITAIFNDAFRAAADSIFDNLFRNHDGNPGLQRAFFDCNTPIELREGVEVTYYRGSCISYCTSYWLDENGSYRWETMEDDCTEGVSCCKLIRSEYCYEYDAEGNPTVMRADEKLEKDNSLFQCVPDAVPEKQSCRTEGVVFNYRTLCIPTCEIDE